jgi:hypothetical protein
MIRAAIYARFSSDRQNDRSVDPLATLHRHPEGKKSRLRPFSSAPISEPNGRTKNGLEAATSGVRGLNKGLQSSSPGR